MVISTSGPQHIKCWSIAGDADASATQRPKGDASKKDDVTLTCAADMVMELRAADARRGAQQLVNIENEQCADHAWVHAQSLASGRAAGAKLLTASASSDVVSPHLVLACNPVIEQANTTADGAESGASIGAQSRRKEKLKATLYVFEHRPGTHGKDTRSHGDDDALQPSGAFMFELIEV